MLDVWFEIAEVSPDVVDVVFSGWLIIDVDVDVDSSVGEEDVVRSTEVDKETLKT